MPSGNEKVETMKFNIALMVAVVLVGCGKNTGVQCTWSVENSVVLSVGPNEKAKCPNDEFIVSYTPLYKPGGEVISIDVQCARRVQTCVSVAQ